MRRFVVVFLLAGVSLPILGQRPTDLAGCEELLRRDSRDLQSSMCFAELVRMEGHDPGPIVSRIEGMIATQPGDPRPRIALGRILQFKDAARAEQLFGEAVSLARAEGDGRIEGWARWRLFMQLAIRGRRDAAEEEAERASEVAERVDDAALSANIGLERARMIGVQLSEFSRAWHILRQVELDPRFDALPSPTRIEVWALSTILALRLGLPEVAFRYASQAEQLAEANGLRKPLGLNLKLKTQAAMAGDIPGFGPDQAIATARRAFEINGAVNNKSGVFESRWLVAQLSGDDEAWEHLEILEDEARSDPFGRHMVPIVWKEMARRMMAESPPRAREAIALLEAALEEARNSGSPRKEANALTDLARARLQTDARDSAIASALDAMNSIESLEDLQQSDTLGPRLFAAKSGIYYLLVDYLLDSGSDEDRRRAFSVVERMRVRSADMSDPDPAPHQAVLSFVVPRGEAGRSWLLLRTSDGLRAYDLATARSIESAVRFWLSLIQQRDPGEPLAASRVYEQVIDDALQDLPEMVEHLVVLPDGILHRIPFDALRPEPDAPPLAMRYRVTVVPSLASWERMRREKTQQATPTALILADPEPPEQSSLPVAWRSADYLGGAVGRLPHARVEGRNAMESLRLGELLVGSEATEGAIKHASTERHRLIHLAAHAVIDEDRPERSAILLSPGEGGEDGLLQASEVSDLQLGGAAVVLSACRSAGGQVLAGEGVMGLARSFFQAGADTVVAGLWPLHDRETADLMEVFYRQLSRGETLDSAMAAAKREMIEQGRPTAAWAGLVVMGAGETVAWPRGRSGWTVPVLILAVVAAGGLFYRFLATGPAKR